MKALIDTCIMIDALMAREPYFDDAENLLIAEANDEYDGVITAGAVLEIYDIIKRRTSDEAAAKDHIVKILRLFDICDTAAGDLMDAAFSDTEDFRAAVTEAAAARTGADYIVTREVEGYAGSGVRAVTPRDFLMMLD